ncbi:MAG: hypothetical protein ACLQE9_05955 [Roseiarcus sp.]
MKAQFQSACEPRAEAAPHSLANPSLAPVLAGARARGMADALELLGVAAALVDECGFALHVNDRAKSLLGPQLWLDGGRLRSVSVELDEAIGAALKGALAAAAPARAVVNVRAADSRGVAAVKALPIATEPHDPFQLVRAVVIIEEQGAVSHGGCEVLN